MEYKSSLVHVLRLLSMLLLVSTALIVGLDTQKKFIFSTFERKATVKDIDALLLLTIIASVCAGYNLLQLSNSFIFHHIKGNREGSNIKLAWLSLLLDQVVAYTSFGATSAAAQASVIALMGVNSLQWLKMCNLYTRFCIQIGGGLACGYVASLLMAVVSAFSAFNLFRFYSSTKFLSRKSRD
ncbi:Casp-like protein 2c1 [Thalictrum thalictroides]|uniref:CASP-like protein n=1 Tax=Thalictrum thalictroides TaxID=46969 RepID=A0A7J6WXZ0_THATH|nr:Casp-like protein 2c1 [Thalictrum thalictroides]